MRQAMLPLATSWRDAIPAYASRSSSTNRPEALALLASDDVDLALTYDYNLAPVRLDRGPT